jgi:hypothetical protein
MNYKQKKLLFQVNVLKTFNIVSSRGKVYPVEPGYRYFHTYNEARQFRAIHKNRTALSEIERIPGMEVRSHRKKFKEMDEVRAA